ncbi:MAG: heme-copper oxidase subunit III [Ginsengibacter sp.]
MKDQKSRIHPYKFTLWIGLASVVMMFAGLTSAYLIKRNLTNWISFEIPLIFWYSTVVIIVSSFTILISRNAFKQRKISSYRRWLFITVMLGIVFVFMQYTGFRELWRNGMTLTRNVSFSFLYIIIGLHALHVLGGIVALIIILIKAFNTRIKNYSSVPIDLMNTYWHFVDFLWIYLLLFLVMIR